MGKKNFVKDFGNFKDFKGNLDGRNFDENDENRVRGRERGEKKKVIVFLGLGILIIVRSLS